MISIAEALELLTVEEKVALLSGADFWTTKENCKIGIPSFMMTDGPNGLRKQTKSSDHLGMNESEPATSFPAACALACSWDGDLMEQLGKVLAEECHEAGIDILLGPGVNLKRSPLGGRNFEYFSEDPYLTSQLAIGYVNGVQKNGIGVSVKHFAANNQETERLVADSIVDERTLRELYLACFEQIIKEAKPWTVMCSYNKLNGTYTSENKWLLKNILKEEWGYEGTVVSDWGAVNIKEESLKAGLDLEMPGCGTENDLKLLEAVKNGTICMEELDEAVGRVLRLSNHLLESRKPRQDLVSKGITEHHDFARKIAGECMVLLKNERAVLPLSTDEKTVVLGDLAMKIRYQGSGSSKVNPRHLENTLEELRKYQPELMYARGYSLTDCTEDEELLKEAVEVSAQCDKVVIVAGIPENMELEGCDKISLKLPDNQLKLIQYMTEIHSAVIVVLCNGAPVEMPFVDEVEGILEGYLAGEAAGGAVADILYGKVNPSGKLAETFPKRLEDTPSYMSFPVMNKESRYTEGIFVGYRYYEKKKVKPLFPFGHGLSYTSFKYTNLQVMKEDEGMAVSVDIENTRETTGAEIVQIYVQKTGSKIIRPEKELKGFQKVWLLPGEKKMVSLKLTERAFQYYDVPAQSWQTEPGTYEILAASSSADIRIREKVTIEKDAVCRIHYDKNSTLAEISKCEEGRIRLAQYMKQCEEEGYPVFADEPEFLQNMYETTPLRWLMMLSGGHFTGEMMADVLKHCNETA